MVLNLNFPTRINKNRSGAKDLRCYAMPGQDVTGVAEVYARLRYS